VENTTAIICDVNASYGTSYSMVILPVLTYGVKTWTMKRRDDILLMRTEMTVVRWAISLTEQKTDGKELKAQKRS